MQQLEVSRRDWGDLRASGLSCGILEGRLWRLLACPGGPLGSSERGAPLGPSGWPLERFGAVLGPSWRPLEQFGAVFGPSGRPLERLGA
eukprot:8491026-Pyramimonas_sp.AAC.1